MSRLWWQMPGPQSFVARLVAGLRDGKNLAVCLPAHFPDGLAAAARAALDDADWAWHTLDLSGDGAAPPLELLFSHFAPDADAGDLRNVPALLRIPAFAGRLIWLDGVTHSTWPAWKKFIGDYQHACRAVSTFERTLFCVLLRGELALEPPAEDVCLARHCWRAASDSIDILLFTASLFADKQFTHLHRRVAVSLVAHLALWDPAVSERLADEPLDALLAPEPLLREIARERGWSADTPFAWHLGTAETFDGAEQTHSAALALTDPGGEIARRVWSAEVGVLLPYVEEKRRELIARLADVFPMPHRTRFGEQIDDVRDLEIGHIEHKVNALAAVDADTRSFVRRLREIRNCLSHLEPLPPRLLLDENNRRR